MVGVVAVHCGAGTHSTELYKKYKHLCKKACISAKNSLLETNSALDAVTKAVIVLENDPLTNCGYGSNLTSNGKVENDASVMDGNSLHFGACGAVRKVKNPIALAHKLCVKQSEQLPLGLIPPSLLVGQGGLDYARINGLDIVNNRSLISRKAYRQYNKYKKVLEAEIQHETLDTVGAVCIDGNGNVAAACSSGGLILKKPGRVGQAAIFASGSWADSSDYNLEPSVAVCTTGCGEHLIQTQLAKEIATGLKLGTTPTLDLHRVMTDKFLKSKYLKDVHTKMGGALVLYRDNLNGDIVVLWGHSTDSMIVGYMGNNDTKVKCQMSVLPTDSNTGTVINVGGSQFYTLDS